MRLVEGGGATNNTRRLLSRGIRRRSSHNPPLVGRKSGHKVQDNTNSHIAEDYTYLEIILYKYFINLSCIIKTYPYLLGQRIEEAKHSWGLLHRLLDHDRYSQGHEGLAEVNHSLSFRCDRHGRNGYIRFLAQELAHHAIPASRGKLILRAIVAILCQTNFIFGGKRV